MKKSILITFIITLLVINNSKATDIMAGEITFKSINYLTYEIVIETYTNTSGGDERDTIEINFGDGTKELIARISKSDFGNDIQYNKYVGTHTYTGSGTFIIRYEDHNRIAGIRNIPNSEMAPFIIESKLSISTALEWNKSVIYSGKSLTQLENSVHKKQ